MEKVQDVMDKNVFNKQQILTNEINIKLKTESEIVLGVEQVQPKKVDERNIKERYRPKSSNKKNHKKRKGKFVEEEQGHIIDLKF